MTDIVVFLRCMNENSTVLHEILTRYCYSKDIQLPEGTTKIEIRLYEGLE